MCAVSVILDYGRDRVPRNQWDRSSFDAFKRTVEEAEKFDAEAEQPHCEDAAKAEWMKEVEQRLHRLEEA